MLSAFNKFISENKLIRTSDKILLAVSGGIDSMVMAHLFLNLNYRIGIAHCNFSLRGNDSDQDENLVREYSNEHRIPFFTKRFETKEFARKNKESVQMAARELRYRWFEEIRIEQQFDLIAVAHNLNDNIETMLINLIRGTGLTGMTGMNPVSNRIIRPLLFATRDEILAYSNLHDIKFRDDKSNADTKYTRNKIRHLVIPVLKEINPSIEITLNESAEIFAGINQIVSEYISRLRENISENSGQYIKFDINLLKNHINNKVVLYELFKPYNITGTILTDLIKVINGRTGGQIITDTHRLIKNRREIIVYDKMGKEEMTYEIRNIQDICNYPGFTSAKIITINETFEIPSDSHLAYIDYQTITFPMTVRKWKVGDYFYPLGMDQKKKLSDYFIDKKYSRFDKENIFILESEGKIVWIIGDRIDNRFRITSLTKKCLFIESNGPL